MASAGRTAQGRCRRCVPATRRRHPAQPAHHSPALQAMSTSLLVLVSPLVRKVAVVEAVGQPAVVLQATRAVSGTGWAGKVWAHT